jgi:hypothetical protein
MRVCSTIVAVADIIVMAGQSRQKDGVALACLHPAIYA